MITKSFKIGQIIAHKGNDHETYHKTFIVTIIGFDRMAIQVKTESGEKYFINSLDIVDMPTAPVVGNLIDVVNDDFFAGDTEELGCKITKVISETSIEVQLSSDNSITCLVEKQDNRWVITENLN